MIYYLSLTLFKLGIFFVDNEQKNTMLKIASKGKNDIRADLARFLVASDIGLLEFMEERGDLEDLFKRIHE